jgi:hypothetical protein
VRLSTSVWGTITSRQGLQGGHVTLQGRLCIAPVSATRAWGSMGRTILRSFRSTSRGSNTRGKNFECVRGCSRWSTTRSVAVVSEAAATVCSSETVARAAAARRHPRESAAFFATSSTRSMAFSRAVTAVVLHLDEPRRVAPVDRDDVDRLDPREHPLEVSEVEPPRVQRARDPGLGEGEGQRPDDDLLHRFASISRKRSDCARFSSRAATAPRSSAESPCSTPTPSDPG